MSRRRIYLVLVGGLACAVATAGTSWGAWIKAGTGTAVSKATSLSAPTGLGAATVTPTSSAIDVSFTPAANPAGTTYTVTRDKKKDGSAGPDVACSGLTASPCHDTGLTGGTAFTYTVTAVLGNWIAAAGTHPTATTTIAPAITMTVSAGSGHRNVFSGTTTVKTGTLTVNVYTGSSASGPPAKTYATTTFSGTSSPYTWSITTANNDLSGINTAQAVQVDGGGQQSNVVTSSPFTAS
jgi:hypothetical protein